MRAVVLHSAHDLRVEDRPEPEATADLVHVRVASGGICGSDLHYFHHGGFGSVRLREPMILGHEVAGHVVSAPDGAGLAAGDRVAVSPSRPCGTCEMCMAGLQNHCPNMAFYGSAMPFPHIQGAFRDELMVRPEQCARVSQDLPVEIAAFAEPLAVVLHALRRAGDIAGKRVLITGCGPIGALTVMAARAEGAGEIVVTDLLSEALDLALDIGADAAIDGSQGPDALARFEAGKGYFDVMIEASGSAAALSAGFRAIRPRGVLVQLGLGGDMALPLMQLVSKEIDLRGSFRFHEEFAVAAAALNARRIDPSRLLTERLPLSKAEAAFELAGDRRKAMKVQLDFTT